MNGLDAEMAEGRRRLQILSANDKIHRCKFCGDWTEDDPSDQVRPADGCSHYLDLDAVWSAFQ